MLTRKDDRPVHMPANPAKFEFDAEVAAIFPDMACRSIPDFLRAHDLHAELCRELFEVGRNSVADLGASRGHFLGALSRRYGKEFHAYACDYSLPMVEHLRKDFPWADVELVDLTAPPFFHDRRTYDVVNLSYVLQFITPAMQRRVLAKVVEMVRPGGLLFIGSKYEVLGQVGEMLHRQYIEWRMERGYSREEIEAKTKALAGSMWPRTRNALLIDLKDFGMENISDTTYNMVFGNIVCRKGGERE
ncbi:TPA: methyltransferase domain-containing protein [Pseudomonas aeruginosa]